MMSNVPKLRFKEFSGEWISKAINEISHVNPKSKDLPDEFIYIDLESVEKGMLIKESRISKNSAPSRAQRLLKNDDILFQTVRPYQKNNYYFSLGDNYVASTGYAQLRTKESSRFLYQKLHTEKFVNAVMLRCTGTSYPAINSTDLGAIKISIPSKPEQEKIASFLTSVDTKIELLIKKEELLQQYKKGVMQKIFSQEIRFKADDGSEYPEWKNKKLNELMYEHKERNFDNKYTKNDVLSVSGEYGIVNQIEFQGRSFAGELIDNYHIVHVNDIVYTKSPLKANPYGIVKVNKKKAGVVSTLYAVYRPKNNLYPLYIDYYFQIDDNVNKYFRPLVHKGAKNDMKINNSYAISDAINIPEIEEQTKIANFLSSIDTKIEHIQKQLNATKAFKKALLQQMFV